jgi:hypothetical protein
MPLERLKRREVHSRDAGQGSRVRRGEGVSTVKSLTCNPAADGIAKGEAGLVAVLETRFDHHRGGGL